MKWLHTPIITIIMNTVSAAVVATIHMAAVAADGDVTLTLKVSPTKHTSLPTDPFNYNRSNEPPYWRFLFNLFISIYFLHCYDFDIFRNKILNILLEFLRDDDVFILQQMSDNSLLFLNKNK